MESAVSLLTVLCYGLALFLWWHRRTPIYLFTLIAGHIGALVSPIWSILYLGSFASDLSVLYEAGSIILYQPVVIGAAWFYSLPVLAVFYLHRSHWWFSGYPAGLMTFAIFFFYHLLLEIVGVRLDIWNYANVPALPFGISPGLLSIGMAALISLALLYVLLLFSHYAWTSMLMAVLPSVLVLSLLVRGLLGAPLWISILFQAESWAASIGMACTLGLLAWWLHITCWGLARVDKQITV